MTQNKTELQGALKAYDERRPMTFLTKNGFFMESRDIETIVKAAQAYADLPEKVRGVRKDAPLEKWVKDYNRAINDILNLLEK